MAVNLPTLKIEPSEHGFAVLLDGDDISGLVSGVTVYLRAKERPLAVLTLPLSGDVSVLGTEPMLDAQTAAVLERLGWRRPA